MTDVISPGPFAPDNPVQRLPWILAMSVLLVLLALLGLGRILHTPARQLIKSKPLQARIYELPASRAAAAAKHVPGVRHASSTQSVQRRAQSHHLMPPMAATHAQPGYTRQPFVRSPRPRTHSAINWATMQSQIDSAIRQSEPSLPQVHDSHTLVARYYLASLLQKLQRVGDMNMPTHLTGVPVIKLVIGTHGELQQLTLLRTSGNDKLDQDALQIARESAPFAPFPDKLRRQTRHFVLVCHMQFVGYRQIYVGY